MNSQRTFPMPLLFVGVGLIILGIASYFLFTPPSHQPETALPTSTASADLSEAKYPRVQLKDALAAYNAHSAIFVDVRGADAYAQQHIPGALSIPLADLANNLSELPKNKWIITYCT